MRLLCDIFFIFRYKLVVADAVIEYLKPIQDKISKYLSDSDLLMGILEEGRQKANEIASKNWIEVQNKLGLKFEIKIDKKVKISS